MADYTGSSMAALAARHAQLGVRTLSSRVRLQKSRGDCSRRVLARVSRARARFAILFPPTETRSHARFPLVPPPLAHLSSHFTLPPSGPPANVTHS